MVVNVRATYLAPATVDPAMIVIGSNVSGEVVRELRVLSSRSSRILTVTSRFDGIRVEFDHRQVAQDHRVRLVVAPCRQHAFDAELKIELELALDDQHRIVRALYVPVHRFLSKGD